MGKYSYILTTEKGQRYIWGKKEALEEFNRLAQTHNHLRLERANMEDGTARVIKSKNNIW